MRPPFLHIGLVVMISGACVLPWQAQAQWTTQTIRLQAGWNAVFLEIEPAPANPDLVFADVPVESVWAWNRRFNPVQFIQDPNTLMPEDPDWLMYVPSGSQLAASRSLFRLLGGRGYLIKLAPSAASTDLILTGRPVTRSIDWLANSLNFTGFSLPATTPPAFQSFFSGITNLNAGPVYRLQPSGAWEQAALTSPMRSGEATWVFMKGRAEFTGPLRIVLESSTGLDFGGSLQDQTLRIRNVSATARTVQLRPLLSAAPVSPDEPALAGSVPLSYWFDPGAPHLPGWANLPPVLVRSNLAAGAEWSVRLAVRRPDMAPFAGPAGSAGALYQSLLEVTDTAGVARCLVPVSAAGLDSLTGSRSLTRFQIQTQGGNDIPLRSGLWVGSATIDRVSQPASFNPAEPKPTASPFQFRLLLHMDSAGTVRLLQKVLQMWQEGTLKPDPANPGKSILDQPGRYVLITDETVIPQIPRLVGATLRDGTQVGRRFSTAAFGFRAPQTMSIMDGTLRCTVALGYDDPLNPFKHLYHPDHDNLDERFEDPVPEGIESMTVIRHMELQFTATDPQQLRLPGWGDNQIGGTYRETITGLNRQSIHLDGIFRLHRASSTPVLNNGL
jgi:hypothetical protein